MAVDRPKACAPRRASLRSPPAPTRMRRNTMARNAKPIKSARTSRGQPLSALREAPPAPPTKPRKDIRDRSQREVRIEIAESEARLLENSLAKWVAQSRREMCRRRYREPLPEFAIGTDYQLAIDRRAVRRERRIHRVVEPREPGVDRRRILGKRRNRQSPVMKWPAR